MYVDPGPVLVNDSSLFVVAAEAKARVSLLSGFGHWRMQGLRRLAPVFLVYNQSQDSRTDGGRFSTQYF